MVSVFAKKKNIQEVGQVGVVSAAAIKFFFYIEPTLDRVVVLSSWITFVVLALRMN